MENSFALTFAPVELALVAGLLDASSLQLPEDPFRGWPVEEIENALAQAQESLAARRYIQMQPDGTIAVDTAVAALVGALAFPDSSLIATLVVDEEPPRTRHVHFASGLVVEQEQQRDDMYRLTAVRERETVSQRLKVFLHLADQPAPLAQPCTLAEAEVDEARGVATMEGEDACAEFLERAGVPPATARSLAKALAHPVSQSALLALAWEAGEAQRVDSFTLVEGVAGLWLFRVLQRDGESWVEVTSCDASSVTRQIEELTCLVIPVTEE